MFWSLNQASKNSGTPAAPREERGLLPERLREQLQERLMLALDFATLGAYELTAPEGDAALAEDLGEPQPAPVPSHRGTATRERPQRVFLFAKVATDCPEQPAADGPPCDPRAETSLRATVGMRGRRRGGMPGAPDQPCASGRHSEPHA
jgi:hypothetical protein